MIISNAVEVVWDACVIPEVFLDPFEQVSCLVDAASLTASIEVMGKRPLLLIHTEQVVGEAPHRGDLFDSVAVGEAVLGISNRSDFQDAYLARSDTAACAFVGCLDNAEDLLQDPAGFTPST